jgi:nucleotide-binding universal stress UspA family protein
MKNILLATDLSRSAAHAVRYAAWLAEALDARLTLMSAYQAAPLFAGTSIPESSADRLPELVCRGLEEIAMKLGTLGGQSISLLARPGDPVPAILSAAREIDADLIVGGRAGVGHEYPSTFGTTVVSLARKTTIPLLIVPQAAGCIKPKAIAIAENFLHDNMPEAIHELLGQFHSRLYTFDVKAKKTGEVVEIYGTDATHCGKELFHLLYEIPVDSETHHSVENFIEVAPIHWLAACPLPGLSPERWVLGRRSKGLAIDIRIPLLVLPDAKKPGT